MQALLRCETNIQKDADGAVQETLTRSVGHGERRVWEVLGLTAARSRR